MADHVRFQILEAFEALLQGLPLGGGNVFMSRAYDLDRSALPGWLLFWEDEASQRDTQGDPPTKQRELQVITAAYHAGEGKATERALNDMARDCEVALEADVTLGGLAITLQLIGTESQWQAEPQAHGALGLRWAVLYRTPEGDPTVTV